MRPKVGLDMVAKTKITGSAGDRTSVVQKLSSLSRSASDTNVCAS